MSITAAGRQLAEQIGARFAERIETLAAGFSDRDRQLLSQLASEIVAADTQRRGLDPHTAVPRG